MYIFAKAGTNECNHESRVLLRNVINKRAKVTFSRQPRIFRENGFIYIVSQTRMQNWQTNDEMKRKKLWRGGGKKKGNSRTIVRLCEGTFA